MVKIKITPEEWIKLVEKKFLQYTELSTMQYWKAKEAKIRIQSALEGRGHLATVKIEHWGKESMFTSGGERLLSWRMISYHMDSDHGISFNQYHRTYKDGEHPTFKQAGAGAIATDAVDWMLEMQYYEFDLHEHRGHKVALDTGIIE